MPRPKLDRQAVFRLMALNYSRKKIVKETGISTRTYWTIKAEYDSLTDGERQAIRGEEEKETKARERKHNNRNCLFCQFEKDIDRKDSDLAKRRIEFKGDNKGKWDAVCFAVLDLSPKVLGHSLVIARTPFNDFTDEIQNKNQEKLTIFKAAIWVANRIKEVLKAEKVYIMSLCDHWEMWETSDGSTTEHLHFHLVPRYPGMRNKMQAGERLLARVGQKWDEEALEKIAKLLNEH